MPFSLKSMGSISYFSKIHGFCGTHGTHANYAPDLWLEYLDLKFFVDPK